MLQRLAADGGFALEVLLEASSVPFIKDLVAKGVGLSVLTRISLADEVQAGTLKAVPFADGGLWMHVDVVVAREGYRSAAVTTFLDYLAASVAEEGEIYGGEAVVKTPSANSVDE